MVSENSKSVDKKIHQYPESFKFLPLSTHEWKDQKANNQKLVQRTGLRK